MEAKGRHITNREIREIDHYKEKGITFDKDAGHENAFSDFKKDKKIDEFVGTVSSFFDTNKHLNVLELCSGTGEFTKLYAPFFKNSKIVGVDISEHVVGLAKEKCENASNITFFVRSAYQTGLEDASIDVVCLFYGLHHLDCDLASKEIFRVLKSGGIAFFCEPNKLNPYVYLVYNNKTLRKIYDLTPDEWLVNPLSLKKQFSQFEVLRVKSMEFMLPLKFLSLRVFKFFDVILTKLFRLIPGGKYIGGTVTFTLRK